MSDEISKRPWRVVYEEDGAVRGVVDADGYMVIQTDSGVYEPDSVTAEYIVRLVNDDWRNEGSDA